MPETPVACSAVSAPPSGAVFRASPPARLGGQHAARSAAPLHGTDLPGDQLTGTVPVEMHAGRGELLQEHVDLVVEPGTSRSPDFGDDL
jgi:hypothetical protein